MASEQIWVGRGEVRPRKGAAPELRDATFVMASFYAYAASQEEFEVLMRERLAEDRLELLEVEDAGPLHEMLDVSEGVSIALEVAESGDPSYALFHTDAPPDAEDADMMTLLDAATTGAAVQFHLVGEDYFYFGFVIDVNDDWALVHMIDSDAVALDGYAAARIDRLANAAVVSDTDTFIMRALTRRGDEPSDPEVPLDSYVSLLTALSERYPLVSLADDTAPPRHHAIGRIIEVADDKVTLAGVDILGEWTGEYDHLYENVGLVAFGREYETALASVLP